MHHHKYQEQSRKARALPTNIKKKAQKQGHHPYVLRLNFTIVSIERILRSTDENLVHTSHTPSRDKNGDNLKTYIYRETTILTEVLRTKLKDR